jgi:hypothetical protein
MAIYHDQIGADGRPYLCFHSIDALPIEGFDPQILLDPFEEQLDLPATFIILANPGSVTIGNVGQQHNILIVLLVNQTDTPQRFRVTILGLIPCQPDDLIALQTGRGVDGCGGFSVELQIHPGSDDKATALSVQVIQPLEIQISPIHKVDAAGKDRDHIQDLHIIGLAIENMDKCGDSALQIHDGVNFNGSLLPAKPGLREQRQTQVNGRGVQDFNRFGHLIFAIQVLGMSDQYHGQILIDLPGAIGIGIGECTEGHIGFDTHVVTARPESIEGGGQVTQAVTKGELSKAHTKQLVPAREFLCTVISFMMVNDFSKFVFGNNIHKL